MFNVFERKTEYMIRKNRGSLIYLLTNDNENTDVFYFKIINYEKYYTPKNDLPSGVFDGKLIWNIGPFFNYTCTRCNDLPAYIYCYTNYAYTNINIINCIYYQKHNSCYRYNGYQYFDIIDNVKMFMFFNGICIELLKEELEEE